jgi:hypothetical protein
MNHSERYNRTIERDEVPKARVMGYVGSIINRQYSTRNENV